MAAAVVSSNAPNRPSGGAPDAMIIPITIVLSATTYTTATGGIPFDIAALLNSVGPWDSGVNPTDVFSMIGFTANGFMVQGFAVGTPTYNDTTDTSFRTHQSLATCPCTARLFCTGAGNAAAFAEIANGDLTDTIRGYLVGQRGGHV